MRAKEVIKNWITKYKLSDTYTIYRLQQENYESEFQGLFVHCYRPKIIQLL